MQCKAPCEGYLSTINPKKGRRNRTRKKKQIVAYFLAITTCKFRIVVLWQSVLADCYLNCQRMRVNNPLWLANSQKGIRVLHHIIHKRTYLIRSLPNIPTLHLLLPNQQPFQLLKILRARLQSFLQNLNLPKFHYSLGGCPVKMIETPMLDSRRHHDDKFHLDWCYWRCYRCLATEELGVVQ